MTRRFLTGVRSEEVSRAHTTAWQICIFSLVVLIFYCQYNKLLQIQWCKTMQVYFPIVLQFRSPTPVSVGYQQGLGKVALLSEVCFLAFTIFQRFPHSLTNNLFLLQIQQGFIPFTVSIQLQLPLNTARKGSFH